MPTRILADIALLIGVFVLPLWLVFIVAAACLFVFDYYYELVLLGILADMLYGVPTRFISLPILYSVFACSIFIIKVFLHRHLKFYS